MHLETLIDEEEAIRIESIESIMNSLDQMPSPVDVTIEKIDLDVYDALLSFREEVRPCYQMS